MLNKERTFTEQFFIAALLPFNIILSSISDYYTTPTFLDDLQTLQYSETSQYWTPMAPYASVG